LGRWQAVLDGRLTIVVISNDDGPSIRQVMCERYGIADVLVQTDFEISNAYLTRGSPSAVIVRKEGLIGSDTATGYQMIHALVRVALRRAAASETPGLPAQPA
jgi:hypothetical protein